ncbi:MAG: flavin reductase family protein [Betaproteobacteria bacterium]
MNEHFYEPGKGHGLAHNPFKSIVAPRPIGWISSMDRDGQINLAPYSFFNAVCDAPPMLYFSTTGERKDSLNNIEATGEFVVNFVGAAQARAMNVTSAAVPHGVDEFALAGLTPVPSIVVAPPRVQGAMAAMECKLTQVLHLVNAAGVAINGWMTIGEVVGVHINGAFLKDGIFDTAGARPIARCGNRGDYTEVNEIFEMIRPA